MHERLIKLTVLAGRYGVHWDANVKPSLQIMCLERALVLEFVRVLFFDYLKVLEERPIDSNPHAHYEFLYENFIKATPEHWLKQAKQRLEVELEKVQLPEEKGEETQDGKV